METHVPFCGPPPAPADLWTRWTLDPVLLTALAVTLALILWRVGNGDRTRPVLGWILVGVMFVSPICAASMSLFSARVAQHLVLVLIAAPLLASLLRGRGVGPGLAAAVFAALFWLWHVPGPYALTLQSDLVYWAMHLSLLGSAVVLWASFRTHVGTAPFATALAAAGTAAQMTLLSVLLIFSDRLWHPWHLATTAPYGLGALDDQVLAGAFMWIAGGLLFAGLVASLALRFLGSHRAVEER
ncbi:cytochrome c oxidase assembly protein [Stappia stellulata]|uniref:cytochrome c oxidase assembly protein n=1 Tax=Stappia stellulata TaxID=71235 RepID=UPI0004081D76|nr:cytochrome c oxidase assembly protein [Stappia stellulata]